ncbi:MAG: PEP-CTERM sorting domain-containing protein, partial [Planctomycetaceae bacterium]
RWTSAVISVIAALCIGRPAPAQNLITNGNFAAGNSGFSSDYTYSPSSNAGGGGEYTVLTNAQDWNPAFYPLEGASGDGDPYFVANGASNVNLIPWYQTVTGSTVTGVTLTNDTNSPVFYRFEALLANLPPSWMARPALYFEINVNGAGWKNFTRSTDTPDGAWGTNYVDTYFQSAPTSLGFRLRNFETAEIGNDFGLDNVYFGLTTNAPSYATNPQIISAGDIANPTYNTGAMYWAPNSSGAGGTNRWSNAPTRTFWAASADGSGFKQAWYNDSSSSQAIFGGTAGTVTIDGQVDTDQLVFTTTGYTITSGTSAPLVNYTGAEPSITLGSGVSATVNVDQNAPGGLAITGTGGSRGTLTLGGFSSVSSTVLTNVNLRLAGTVTGDVLVAANATLGGTGLIGGAILGPGMVSPGNSPGILTADSVEPSGGTKFTFEFSGTAPNYTNAAASINDILRLTGETPFAAGLTSANTKTLYLNMTKEQLALGTILQGGFFTDSDADFLSLINNATWDNAGFTVYVLGDGNGSNSFLNGQGYYNWRNPAMFGWTQSLFASTQLVTANFAGGSETGRVLQLVVGVPEPSTYVLAGIGGAIAGLMSLRRRAKRVA